ncbi:MAG: 50S ribosomal protein L15 [Deltaproteobacteria bacterium]|nr:50S ribosomal protein L15 [Nannocystaceae bacterium]
MGTTLHTLKPPAGARHKMKRVGRGVGSGKGKTSGRGMKGQMARRQPTRPGFEGGQNPIHRRVPKRGFVNNFRVEYQAVNLCLIDGKFAADEEITVESLRAKGLVPKKTKLIKLLGMGEISSAVKIKCHRASDTAKSKVEAAGGSVEVLEAEAPAAAATA